MPRRKRIPKPPAMKAIEQRLTALERRVRIGTSGAMPALGDQGDVVLLNGVEANELMLYIENDGTIYRRQSMPIMRNLARKMERGTYDHRKAEKAFMNLANDGAKKYAKEFGGGAWNRQFPVDERREAARTMADRFRNACERGEYDFCKFNVDRVRESMSGVGASCTLTLHNSSGAEVGYGPSRKGVLKDMLVEARQRSRVEKRTHIVKRACASGSSAVIARCNNGSCKMTAAGKRSFKSVPGLAGKKRKTKKRKR